MTIVAGFTSNSGVIIAADSQEVISDYTKSTTSKIKLLMRGYEWCVGISGASEDGAYLDLFQDEVTSQLLKIEKYDYEKMLSVIRAVIHRLHKQHIWPQKEKRTPFQALIVTQCVAEPTSPRALRPRLLEVKDSVVVPVYRFRPIGVGAHMATYLKRQFLDSHDTVDISLDHVADMLVLMIREIKKAIVGCDDRTVVSLFYPDGRHRWMTEKEVAEIEELSTELETASLYSLLALTNSDISDDEFCKIQEVNFSDKIQAIAKKRANFIARRNKLLEKLPSYRGKVSTFMGSSVG